MASSAFKSTTRRTLHAAADDRRDKAPPCPRRSRSVSAAPRPRARDQQLGGEYATSTTRTNPLFDDRAGAGVPASASPSPPLASGGGGAGSRARERGREAARKNKGGPAACSGRARSVSVAPQRRRDASSVSTENGGGGGRRASRAPSVARGSETDAEFRDVSRELQSWRSRHSVSSSIETIRQRNHSNVPVEQVLEIPPEFDPDSAEFVSDISDYATKSRKGEILEIPLEFDTSDAELGHDTRNYSELQWEQMEIPLEFDPDSAEVASDITEYTTKLKQSHERAQKLRADLAVEEQREQELSRVLKGIVTVPNFTETHKQRPRRKSSIERLKVSRHLAEEAMNYFEECVSISTLDSTDFSSIEDPQPNSVASVSRKSNHTFSHKEIPSLLEFHTPTDRYAHNEELHDNQTQCSISITRNNSSDDLDGFDTPRSRSSCFSFTREPAKTAEDHDVRQYLTSFGRGISKEIRETKSSYCADDYIFEKSNADLFTDIAAVRDRIEYGGLLICNIRRF